MSANAGSPRRLVMVAPNWLGDAVMSLAAVDRVARSSGWELTVVASPYTARVYWGVDGVHEIQADAPGGRAPRIRDRARALRAYGADTVVVLPPSFSSAVPAWLARVRVRVGWASDGRRALLTHAVAVAPRTTHLSTGYADLMDHALAGAASAEPRVEGAAAPRARLRVGDEERSRLDRVLARFGVSRGSYVLVVPGAAFGPAKSWPWERYRRVCEALARDTPVVLSGSAGDRAVCAQIRDGLQGVADLAGETTLGEFFALVEGARAVLANDSGAPHVAASLAVPTVVLFGSTSPEWTAPVGERVRVLQHKVHCNPCFRRTCPTQLECFNGIDPADVLANVRALLSS
ncbi:MAG TPA: lipopolysaccharide heptosyltransferase II [Candidatus Krumholzibacteria bacterium]|nr:lipopolysaccharide heptosyltransferase II [Candidatus Krumholzibacteria bacterium]